MSHVRPLIRCFKNLRPLKVINNTVIIIANNTSIPFPFVFQSN